MIIIKDDFIGEKAALQARADAIANGFNAETGPDGGVYEGVAKEPRIHERPEFKASLASLYKVKEEEIKFAFGCFRRDMKGMFTHSYAHADTICASHAGLLYLTPFEYTSGGTAFYRHIPSGLMQHPVLPPKEDAQLTADWMVKTKWEMHSFIHMVFDRFVTYPCSYYHNRFPMEGFGETDEDSRLVYVVFFDLLSVTNTAITRSS